MASDLQKTIAGALLFGASALTGNALLMTAAGGISVNWTSEGLAGLWGALAPGTPLARAGGRAIRSAVTHLRRDYQQEYGKQADTNAFTLVADCADAAAAAIAPNDNPAIAAQRSLTVALDDLLHSHEERQRRFLERELLPATATAFQRELENDADAWRGYYGAVLNILVANQAAVTGHLERLPELLAALQDDQAAHNALMDSHEQLLVEIAALRDALAQMNQSNPKRPIGKAYIDTSVARNGGSATVRNDRTGEASSIPEGVSADELYSGSAVAEGPGSVALTENRSGAQHTPDPAPEPGRPPAIVLTLHFSPTPAGAQVRWSADEIGGFTSAFTSPFPGPALPAVLRALEQRQHPGFALEPGDTAQLAALGLLTDDNRLPPDLPRRVGRALYTALVNGQGIAAMAVAQAQAAQTNRPLALRLLLPPDAVALAALPWELLWADGPAPLLLSATPSLLLTRHLDRPDPLPPLAERRGRPLRILALTPQTQRDPGDLAEIQRELAALWADLRATGTAEISEVSPVTRADLARAMRHKPDIVQFTGHGWYADGRGVLLLDPTGGGASADLVAADKVAVALRGARMVLLAACRGGQSAGITGGAESLLTGVAPALSALGVPIVVGMQLGLRVGSALQAVEAVYSALAAGLSAQAAVGRARDELYVTETQDGAWYVPVLYVATRDAGPVYV